MHPDFPKTLPYVTGRKHRRWITRRWSVTEILALDKNGKQRTQYDPGVSLGVYVWKGEVWELAGIYGSRNAARSAAARIR